VLDLLEAFLAPLATALEPEEASLGGEWSTSLRRTYAHTGQSGTGEGPFVEVVDARWRGVVRGPSSLTGLAFMVTVEGVAWVRSKPPVADPEVEVSLHRWADRTDGASLAASFHGALPPSVPVPCGDRPREACRVNEGRVTMGRPTVVAAVGEVWFAVLLLPGAAVRVARNRLWHLRDELAGSLPEAVRRLMTRGRTGLLRARDLGGGP
jgi:hypothetical protein